MLLYSIRELKRTVDSICIVYTVLYYHSHPENHRLRSRKVWPTPSPCGASFTIFLSIEEAAAASSSAVLTLFSLSRATLPARHWGAILLPSIVMGEIAIRSCVLCNVREIKKYKRTVSKPKKPKSHITVCLNHCWGDAVQNAWDKKNFKSHIYI